MDKKRISRTAVSGITVEILNKVAPLVILFIVQRRLGVDSFGFAMFGISMVELFLPLVVFGYSHLGSIRLARLKNDPVAAGSFICDVLTLRMIHAIVLSIFLCAITFLVPDYQEYQTMALSLSFSFFAAAFEVMWVFMAIQKMAVFNFFIGAGRIVSLALILILINSPADGLLFAVLSLLSNALINMFTAILIFRQFPLKPPSLRRMGQIFRQSLSFAVILALTGFLDRMDILLVEQTAGLTGTGLYAGPARIAHSLSQVANAIILTFFSEMVVLKSRESFQKHLTLGTFTLISYCAPIVAGGQFVSSALLNFLFGPEYIQVGSILKIMLINMTLGAFILAFGTQILVLKDKMKFLSLSLAAGACTATFCAAAFSRSAGLEGIIWGVVAGKSLALILIAGKVYQLMKFLPWGVSIRGILPSAVMTLTLLSYKPENFFSTIIFGMFICLGSMLFLNRNQIGDLMKTWKK